MNTEPALTALTVTVWTAGVLLGVAVIHAVGNLGWDLLTALAN